MGNIRSKILNRRRRSRTRGLEDDGRGARGNEAWGEIHLDHYYMQEVSEYFVTTPCTARILKCTVQRRSVESDRNSTMHSHFKDYRCIKVHNV